MEKSQRLVDPRSSAERAQHDRKFVDIGAGRAKLRRHAGLLQPGAFKPCDIVAATNLSHPLLHGALLEYESELARNIA